MMRMRIISDPEVIVSVARVGGLRAASRTLGLAQSNVSRRIDALETRLGVRLLARTRRGIALTDAGRAYVAKVEPALAAIIAGERAAQAMLNYPAGVLRITAPLAFGRRIVVPAAAAFVVAHPEVRLDLSFSDAHLDLADGGFDLGIRLGRIRETAAVVRLLRKSTLTLVAAPGYLEARAAVETTADLADQFCIVVSTSRLRRTWPMRRLGGKEVLVEVAATHIADDVEAALCLARAGLGVTLLPDWLVQDDLDRGTLVRVLPDHTGGAYDAHIVLPAGSAVSAKSRAFIAFIVKAQGPLPAHC